MQGHEDLFRHEALQNRETAWLGQVVLIRPLSITVLSFLAALIALSLVAILFWGEYTKTASVTGYLVPDRGLTKVYPPQLARVIQSQVTEGQRVRQGDVLFVLSSERANSAQEETQATISQKLRLRLESLRGDVGKQQDLQQTQDAALKKQRGHLRREHRQLEQEIETQRQRATLAAEAVDRFRRLYDLKLVGELQLQAQQEELLAQRGRLQTLVRNQLTLQREISLAQFELDDQHAKNEFRQTEMLRNMAMLEQELADSEGQREVVVLAPQEGTVTAILAQPGQTVSTDRPLLSLVPAGSTLKAELFSPSRSVGFVHPHQPVLLRYQAYPYQKFGHHKGEVIAVSKSPLQPGELPFPLPSNTAESVYRIDVALAAQTVMAYGTPQALQAGMQLEASILLDRRRLFEWILEPLYTLTGKM
jgi:membrane fusion protein